jgi:hypothetical protein
MENNNNNDSSANTTILIVLLVIIVGFGVWWFARRGNAPAAAPGLNVNVTTPTNTSSNPPASNPSTPSGY